MDRPSDEAESSADPGAPSDAEVRIDKVEMVMLQSYPPQVRVLIEGQVVGACELAEPRVERLDKSFSIDLEPSGGEGGCEGAHSFTRSIALPTSDAAPGRYEVIVEGERVSSFELGE